MQVPRFTQIAATGTGSSIYCYALDEEGRVWCHGAWVDSATWKPKGTYWRPIGIAGPPPEPAPKPPTLEELAAQEVEELLR